VGLVQIYPYLIVNDACLMESRREERVLQLLRMFNYFLGRQKVYKVFLWLDEC
jgi:transformation/transcription domain-associated protein